MYLKTENFSKTFISSPFGLAVTEVKKQFFNTIETIHYHLFWDFGSEATEGTTLFHMTINVTGQFFRNHVLLCVKSRV